MTRRSRIVVGAVTALAVAVGATTAVAVAGTGGAPAVAGSAFVAAESAPQADTAPDQGTTPSPQTAPDTTPGTTPDRTAPGGERSGRPDRGDCPDGPPDGEHQRHAPSDDQSQTTPEASF